MKALIRWGISVACLILVGTIAQSYVWVSPALKRPLGHAPDMFSEPPYYYAAPDGKIYGPYYYLRPPFPPAGGFLPGPIGHAIMSGNLPHTLLLDKQAMVLGDMPLLKKKKEDNAQGSQGPPPGQQGPPPYGMGPPPYGMGPPPQYGMGPPPGAQGPPQQGYAGLPHGSGGVPGPYPMINGPSAMQMPAYGPNSPMGMMPPAGMPGPYPMGPGPGMMPPGAGVQMPYPMGMMPPGGMPYRQPLAYPPQMPFAPTMPMPNRQVGYYQPGSVIPYAAPRQGAQGIWLVQNTAPMMAPTLRPPYSPMLSPPYGPMQGMQPMLNPRFGPMQGMQPFVYPMPYFGMQPMGPVLMPSPYGRGGPMPGMSSMPSQPSFPPMPSMPSTGGQSSMPGMPPMPSLPGMPSTPGMRMQPYGAFQYFGPIGTYDRFSNMQMPTLPMQPQYPQAGRMEGTAPPPMKGGNAFPTHPFTRSPRDFFMWGEMMEDERVRGNRPYPVPQ